MREQYKVDIPKEWETNKKAGLCPVCGKTSDQFEKRRRVYCSEKCGNEYASRFITWEETRRKLIEKNSKCRICGITEKKWKKNRVKKRQNVLDALALKYEKEIRAFKFKRIAEAERSFLRTVKEIEEEPLGAWGTQRFLESLGEKIPSDFNYFFGFEVDHVVAIANEGDMWDEKNLQVLCKPCHIKKTKNDMKLMRKNNANNTN